jgi:hypothetical protein
MRFTLHLRLSTLLLILVSCWMSAHSQTDGDSYVFHPNQEVRVAALPSVVAASTSESATLAASVATAVMDRNVCCDRNSALEDQVASAGKLSVKELGEKLRGKYYLSSGLPIVVVDQYWPAASVNPEGIIGSLMAQCPLLMLWNGRLYVMYGAVFDEYKYYSGTNVHVIRTLLLVDTRFSDERRYVSFNRQTDDWGRVTGLLALTTKR